MRSRAKRQTDSRVRAAHLSGGFVFRTSSEMMIICNAEVIHI